MSAEPPGADLGALPALEDALAPLVEASELTAEQSAALRDLLHLARRSAAELVELRALERREREAAAADEAAGRGDAGLRAYARGMGRRRGGRGRGPGTDWWAVAEHFAAIPPSVSPVRALERVSRPRMVSPKTARGALWKVFAEAHEQLAELEEKHRTDCERAPGPPQLSPPAELRKLRALVAGLRRLPRSLPPAARAFPAQSRRAGKAGRREAGSMDRRCRKPGAARRRKA